MAETTQRAANRKEVARVFRERLAQALTRSGLRPAGLAARIGVDRSTLSQLLSGESDRLPRADTVAAMAGELQVSLDWLLGLTSEAKRGADILLESLQVAPSSQAPVDEQLQRWQQEAIGYKVRHVPASLPDLVKTDEVIRYEYKDFAGRGAEEVIVAGSDELKRTRMPEADVEICMRVQDLRVFARGGGLWDHLPRDARLAQIDRMVELNEELYPSLRFYLYDGLTHYSVPYTIFGPLRAAIYVGQLYFVFNTRDHIRVLTRHFDNLIKGASVQAHEFGRFLRDLRSEVADLPEYPLRPAGSAG